MALRASPGTRWRSLTRSVYMPPLDGVACTASGSRTAVSSARQTITSVRTPLRSAVSVRESHLPPMLAV